ncbi:MAG: hypothetical protein ABR865_05175 [Terracidiphilus sp.]
MANALESPGTKPGNGLTNDENRRVAEAQHAALERQRPATPGAEFATREYSLAKDVKSRAPHRP